MALSQRFARHAPAPTTDQLKALREQIFDLSQSAFAELLEVSVSTVQKWEAGRNPIPAPVFMLALIYAQSDFDRAGIKQWRDFVLRGFLPGGLKFRGNHYQKTS